MSTIHILLEIQKWVVWGTVPAAVGFPIWYHWRIRWRKNPVGQHIMAYSTVVALLYLTALLQYLHLSLLAMTWIGVVITLLMMLVVWWRVIIFVWLYRHAHRRRDHEQNASFSTTERPFSNKDAP